MKERVQKMNGRKSMKPGGVIRTVNVRATNIRVTNIRAVNMSLQSKLQKEDMVVTAVYMRLN